MQLVKAVTKIPSASLAQGLTMLVLRLVVPIVMKQGSTS
jgi:hypothetical protein